MFTSWTLILKVKHDKKQKTRAAATIRALEK